MSFTKMSKLISKNLYPYAMLFNSYFLSAIWLTHGEFCAISKGTV